MSGIFVVTDADFDQEVLKSDLPVLVDFWAEWCAPCKMIAPLVENLSKEFEGKLNVAKMDIDSNPTTPMTYGIRSIPTLLLFKNGEPIDQIVGAVPMSVLKKKIETALN